VSIQSDESGHCHESRNVSDYPPQIPVLDYSRPQLPIPTTLLNHHRRLPCSSNTLPSSTTLPTTLLRKYSHRLTYPKLPYPTNLLDHTTLLDYPRPLPSSTTLFSYSSTIYPTTPSSSTILLNYSPPVPYSDFRSRFPLPSPADSPIRLLSSTTVPDKPRGLLYLPRLPSPTTLFRCDDREAVEKEGGVNGRTSASCRSSPVKIVRRQLPLHPFVDHRAQAVPERRNGPILDESRSGQART
jgi:hypothetical protein